MTEKLQVTSLEAIREQAAPIQTLPGWAEDEPLVVRLRRLSLLDLLINGQVPNNLLAVAERFVKPEVGEDGRRKNPIDGLGMEDYGKLGELMNVVAKAALVEPTYDEIVEAAGNLTDVQLNAIFLYSLQGARALELFRKQTRADQTTGGDGEGVGEGAE